MLCRVSESSLAEPHVLRNTDGVLPFHSQSLASNIYSSCELQLLSWLNMHYQSTRETVWGTGRIQALYTHIHNAFFKVNRVHLSLVCFFLYLSGLYSEMLFTGDVPSARWIVNFDLDFADGLVLAALLAAYCPYLVSLAECLFIFCGTS